MEELTVLMLAASLALCATVLLTRRPDSRLASLSSVVSVLAVASVLVDPTIETGSAQMLICIVAPVAATFYSLAVMLFGRRWNGYEEKGHGHAGGPLQLRPFEPGPAGLERHGVPHQDGRDRAGDPDKDQHGDRQRDCRGVRIRDPLQLALHPQQDRAIGEAGHIRGRQGAPGDHRRGPRRRPDDRRLLRRAAVIAFLLFGERR